MKFCTNCGVEYEICSGVCPHCFRDQVVPEEIIDRRLQECQAFGWQTGTPKFGYPGERGALYVSLATCITVIAVLGTMTLGLFALAVTLNLLYVLFAHWTLKARMLQVSNSSFPNVYRVVKVTAYRLGIARPSVFVTEGANYNAYTAGFFHYGFVVINSALVRDFSADELLFVIGHELGHIKRCHTTWLNLMQPAQGAGAKFILAPLMRVIFNVWSVKSEYTADQAGLIACRNPGAAVMTMLKLAGGSEVEEKVNISELERLANEEPELAGGLLEYLGTHPFIENRIRQLLNFAASSTFESATSS